MENRAKVKTEERVVYGHRYNSIDSVQRRRAQG